MRHEIDITDLMTSIMKALPKDLKKKLIKEIKESSDKKSINQIKAFVDQYDHDSQIDSMIANLASNIIGHVGKSLTQAAKKAGKGGLCGIEAGYLAIEAIHTETEMMMQAIKQVEAEDPKHDCENH